jgi:hypothetical protein
LAWSFAKNNCRGIPKLGATIIFLLYILVYKHIPI